MIVVIGSLYYGEPLNHIDKVVSGVKKLIKYAEEVSLVVFTGGEDVHPYFYNGVDHRDLCMTNILRDQAEKKVFDFCIEHNIKMTGVCRGVQFLNVMAGGFMYHHITNHAGVTHGAYFPCDNTIKDVTSTHHQLVGLPDGAIPIAWSSPKRSAIYIGPQGIQVEVPKYEIEAAIFPNINTMGVQYHPEMMREKDPSRIHYSQMITDFVKMDLKEFIDIYNGGIIHDRSREAGSPREG